MIRKLTRRTLMLGPVVMALALAAQPAVASTPINQSDDYGDYQINDNETTRGANCVYEGSKTNAKNVLDKISIRPPVVHSFGPLPGNRNQWVGWRFIIQRDTNFDNEFGDLHKSSWVKAKANEGIPADFSRRTWHAAENPQGNYRVRIVIRWYEPGSSTDESGKVVEEIDWYRALKGDSTKNRQNSCYRDWQGS